MFMKVLLPVFSLLLELIFFIDVFVVFMISAGTWEIFGKF